MQLSEVMGMAQAKYEAAAAAWEKRVEISEHFEFEKEIVSRPQMGHTCAA